MRRDLPDLDDRIRANDLAPLLEWLRANVHQFGRRFAASELIERATGEPPSLEPFLQYISGKLGEVYGI
jgi:carboxypeptidase Taq